MAIKTGYPKGSQLTKERHFGKKSMNGHENGVKEGTHWVWQQFKKYEKFYLLHPLIDWCNFPQSRINTAVLQNQRYFFAIYDTILGLDNLTLKLQFSETNDTIYYEKFMKLE